MRHASDGHGGRMISSKRSCLYWLLIRFHIMESIITSPHRRKYLWWRRSCLLATSIMARWDAIWWVLRLSHHWVLSQDRSTTAVIPSDPYGHKHSFSKINLHNHIHGSSKQTQIQKSSYSESDLSAIYHLLRIVPPDSSSMITHALLMQFTLALEEIYALQINQIPILHF